MCDKFPNHLFAFFSADCPHKYFFNNKSLFKSLSYTSTFCNGIEDTERRVIWLSIKAIHGIFHCWELNRGPLAL